MTHAHRMIGLACACALLTGCETADRLIWPALAGEWPTRAEAAGDAEEIGAGQEPASETERLAVSPLSGSALPGDAEVGARRPLVVIRFYDEDVAYRDLLYQAVAAALQHKPTVVFDLVAVAPAGDTERAAAAMKRNAEDVARTLVEMGVPGERMTVSGMMSRDTEVDEVHIYVR